MEKLSVNYPCCCFLSGASGARSLRAFESTLFALSRVTTWMDGWIASLRPFQQYLCHIRMIGG